MTRDAELKARDFVALVSAGVHAETEVGVAQRLLLQAQTALNSYANPDWACSEGWPAFADRLLELARGAEPGSDHQLAYVNALCSSVLSLRHAAILAALLDADERLPEERRVDPAEHGLPGLSVDTELRWRIVTALAAGGDIDGHGPEAPFIDAEVQRDPTAAGQRHGAQASAARPQAAVKDEAWQQVIENDTLANITTRAIVAGFAVPGQAGLLHPFRDRYFDAIAAVWERRSSEVAQTVVVGLYPSWDVSEAGIAAADDFLAGDLPPALRRLVVEGRAGVVRALAAREFDGRQSD
jgi:aminopeptidase N